MKPIVIMVLLLSLTNVLEAQRIKLPSGIPGLGPASRSVERRAVMSAGHPFGRYLSPTAGDGRP